MASTQPMDAGDAAAVGERREAVSEEAVAHREKPGAVRGAPSGSQLVPLAAPQLGRIGAALEALWTAAEAMRAWEPYVEVALSDALDASADAAALEMLAAAVRLTAARTDDADAEEPAIAACSAALVDALPRLLAKYSSDAARLADVLLLPAAMDLAVYADTQNLGALDSLWDTVCAHFMRHVAPAFLRNAAEAWYGLLRWKWSSQIRKCRCCPYRSVMGSTAAGISPMVVGWSIPATGSTPVRG